MATNEGDEFDLDFTKVFSPKTLVAEPVTTPVEEKKLEDEAVIGESQLTSNGYFVRIFPDAPRRKAVNNPPVIMVVEDDEVTATIIERVLVSNGYKVIKAANRQGVVDGFKGRPDLILLDVLLPDANGFDIMNRIRQNEKLKVLPVLMLSSLGSLQDILKGLTLGANGYLTKPAKSRALLEAIKNVLGD